MRFSSSSVFKVALFCLATGIRANAEKVADHDDSLDLLKPGPATIHMFTGHKNCNNSTLQKKTSFEIDRCHNINPLFINEFSFIVPPVCKNGTLAEYTAFQASNCWGDVWHSWEVTDAHVDQCLGTATDTKKLMSFALVCDGIKRNNSKARLIATLLLLSGLSLAVLGLLLACIRGSLVLVSKTLGSFVWALRTLVMMAKKLILSFTGPAKTTSPEEKAKKEE